MLRQLTLQVLNITVLYYILYFTTYFSELENKFDDCSYELSKTKQRNEKLETLLVETQSELSVCIHWSLCRLSITLVCAGVRCSSQWEGSEGHLCADWLGEENSG